MGGQKREDKIEGRSRAGRTVEDPAMEVLWRICEEDHPLAESRVAL